MKNLFTVQKSFLNWQNSVYQLTAEMVKSKLEFLPHQPFFDVKVPTMETIQNQVGIEAVQANFIKGLDAIEENVKHVNGYLEKVNEANKLLLTELGFKPEFGTKHISEFQKNMQEEIKNSFETIRKNFNELVDEEKKKQSEAKK